MSTGRPRKVSSPINDCIFTAKTYYPESEVDDPEYWGKSQDQLEKEWFLFTQRATTIREACVRSVHTAAAALYKSMAEHYVNTHDAIPNAHDGADIFGVDLLAEGEDPHDMLEHESILSSRDLRNALCELDEYPRKVMNSLAEIFESEGAEMGCGRVGEKKNRSGHWQEDVVQHPTALFACAQPECHMHALPWPAINVHWCEAHPDESVWEDSAYEARNRFRAEVWKDGVETAEKILAVLIEKGLATEDQHISGLDNLVKEGRVFCSCKDPAMAPPDGLNWAGLVSIWV